MSKEIVKSGEVLLYSYDGAKEYVDVYFRDETFWMTQSAMAELFDCSADNISLHLKNIYEDGELERIATTEEFSVVRQEGNRTVNRTIEFYNLDAIIEFDSSKKENQGQPWSTEHDQCLRDLYQKGVPVTEIAITLKRNSGAVRARLKKLGIAE